MTFRPNYDGIGDMLTAPWMVAAMHGRAESGLEVAKASAPRDTGEYEASLQVRSGVTQGRKTRRAFGRVESTDGKALHLEFGTEHTPAHRTLGKALDVMGR